VPQPSWLLYGAYGYTGDLIAREALRRGLTPILAGRDRSRLAAQARALGLDFRAFALTDEAELRRGLEGTVAVLHCAGPFFRTSRPMVEGCLETGAHYLDITGEVAGLEQVLRAAPRAEAAGVVLLPGVGFDVVPTDCLAARLAAALPGSTDLSLAFHQEGGMLSRGTVRTAIAGLPYGGAIRRAGRLERVPLAAEAREIEFLAGRRWTMSVPWGDLATAWRSTGIPNIKIYAGASPRRIRRLRRLRPLLPLLRLPAVARIVTHLATRGVAGPSATTRSEARAWLWGEVRGPGGSATATLETPEGYTFTALAALESLARVLDGRVAPGAWTPSQAFGAGFVAELPGTTEGPLA